MSAVLARDGTKTKRLFFFFFLLVQETPIGETGLIRDADHVHRQNKGKNMF